MKPKDDLHYGNDTIFRYHENGNPEDKANVEKILESIFDDKIQSGSSALSDKQLQLRSKCVKYGLSCVDSFVEQYHDGEYVSGYHDFFSRVVDTFLDKVKKKEHLAEKEKTVTNVKPKDKPHYVNNREFSLAVVQHCEKVQAAKRNNRDVPIVPNYIAECFLKIAEGLSHKANFVRYTYREEMVMDAVENCLKAIENYDIEAATRSGNPNAFAYFTQISWYAFLRRINREKKQQDIKLKYISEAGVEQHIEVGDDDTDWSNVVPFVETLRHRIDLVRDADAEFKEYLQDYKKRRRRTVKADSDLSEFLVD